jgi:meiotically up-regulated gene 157 (Mug157) protein
MEKIVDSLDLMAKEIGETLTDFMLNHSSIDPPKFEEVYALTPEGDRSYGYLDDAGRKIQSSLSISYEKFYSTLQPLLKDQSDEVLSEMSKLQEIVVRTIDHRITWCENTQQALDRALVALEGQMKLIKSI